MMFPLLCGAARSLPAINRFLIPVVPLALSAGWLFNEQRTAAASKETTNKPSFSLLRSPLLDGNECALASADADLAVVKNRVPLAARQATFIVMLLYLAINIVSYGVELVVSGDDGEHGNALALTVFSCLLFTWVLVACADSVAFKDPKRTKAPWVLFLLSVLCALVQASLATGCHPASSSSGFAGLRFWFWLYSWFLCLECFVACVAPVSCEQVHTQKPVSNGQEEGLSGVEKVWDVNPEQRCYDLHRILLFTWFSPILDIGDSKQLCASDLPPLMRKDRASHNWSHFSTLLGPAQWRREDPAERAQRQKDKMAKLTAATSVDSTSVDTAAEAAEVLEVRAKTSAASSIADFANSTIATSDPPRIASRRNTTPRPLLPPQKRRLWWTLVRLTKPWFLASGTFAFFNLLASYIQILSMYIVLNNVGAGQSSDSDDDKDDKDDDDGGSSGGSSLFAGAGPLVVKGAVGGLFLGPVLAAATTVLQQHLARRVAVKARAALVQLLYRKALRVDLAAQDAKIGEIVNLMSSDIDSILNAVGSVHYLWIPLLQLVAAALLLNLLVGPSFWAAVAFMVAVLPVYAVGFGRLQKYQQALMKRKDDRLGVITEVLAGVRIIKLCALEKGFLAKIQAARAGELAVLRQFLYLLTVLWVVILSTPTLTGVATFVTRTAILGKSLDAATAFTTLALLDQLRSSFTQLPWVANQLIQAQVSLVRVGAFLDRTEVNRQHRARTHTAARFNATRGGTVTSTCFVDFLEGEHSEEASGSLSVDGAAGSGSGGRGYDGEQNNPLGLFHGSDGIDKTVTTTTTTTTMSGPSSVQGRQRLPSGQLQHKDERADPPPTLHPPSLPPPVKVQISNGTFRWGDGKEKKSEGSAKSTSKDGAAVAGATSSGVGAMEEDEEEVKEGETEETTQENLQIDTRKNGYSALPSSSLSKGAHDATDKQEGSKNGGEESESSALAGDVVDDNDSKQGEEVEQEEQDAQVNALRGVNLEVSEGSLCCVYGVTGGGKTSLLSALLGEMTTVEGFVRLDGSVAYTAQKAWNQNATIRSNILFNGCNDFASPEEQSRYDAAVAACALASDFQVLKGGDLTEIGEKGITLSGGQQQRIALARACFADADVYLLDDPLSAVDAHVGEHMFHSAVCGLLKHKTRVLVTHQVALTLPKADWVVVVGSGGEILEQGTGDNLRLDPASHLNNLLRSLGKQEGEEEGEEEEEEGGDDGGVGDADEAGEVVTGGDDDDDDDDEKTPLSPPSSPSSSSPRSPTSRGKSPKHAKKKKFDAARLSTSEAMASAQLVKEEERQQGAPSWAVYESYVQACGGWPVVGFVVLLTFAVTGLAYVAALAMAAWIEDMESGGAADNRRGLYNYLAATAVWVFCMWAWIFVRQLASLRASNTLHGKMMESVLRAPIGWFDRTPLGRIQNRFSSDMQSLDREVMSSVMGFVLCASAPLMSLFVLFTHLPLFLAPVFLLVVLCASKVAKRYLTTARELKRLQSTAKSPLYAHFTETLHGLSTLRAFGGAEERFTSQNLVKVDEANAAELYLWCAQRWLGFRLNCLGAVVNGTCGAYIWFAGDMNPAIAGLVLNYASDFTAYVAAMITSLASMEMAMNAVERAGEFCALPQEAAAESPLDAQLEAEAWPSGGAIRAKNLSLRYESSTSNVVDGISFDIPSKASVGIVGRTGAGKSTLSLALLRVLEVWEGTLAIDGVDLSSVGLDRLRSSVAIVPQDPMLFNGSVRFNLDPFDRYEDHVLLAALERVQLTELWTNKAAALGRKSSGSNLAAMSSQLELQLEGERETGGASAVAAADDKGGGKDSNTLKASHKGANKGLAEPLLSGADDDFNLKESLVSGVASGGVVGSSGSFLDMAVSESGSNLSVGERQLLCLARALIRNNKVLVMDEATANVDPQTDERIQRVIRNELASATVLTVAHRLGTIIYYDLVMVMGQGKILELATPSELLADKSSAFFAMCEKTGDLEHLISEANLSEEKKKTQEGAAAAGTHQEVQS